MNVDHLLRDAAADLRGDGERTTDTEAALSAVSAVRAAGSAERRTRRLAIAAAAVVLLASAIVGVVALTRDADEQVTVDGPPTSSPPTVAAGTAPDVGVASQGLPIEVEPATGLHPGDTVVARGEGFEPGTLVGVVQCVLDADGSLRGSGDCDLGLLGTGSKADADGRATGSIEVRQVISVTGVGGVDCAAAGVRCGVALGQIDDYAKSGAAPIAFAADVPPVALPTIEVSPTTGLEHGDVVTVSGSGFDPLGATTPTTDGSSPDVGWAPPDGTWVYLYLCRGDGDCIGMAPVGDEAGSGTSVRVADDGTFSADATVWRGFAAEMSGSDVDCLADACAVRVVTDRGLSPAPVPVTFDPTSPGPDRPTLTATPHVGLRPGDDVTVTVTGLTPGRRLRVGGCGAFDETYTVEGSCTLSVSFAEGTAGPDGTWTGHLTMTSPAGYGVDCTREWACGLTVAGVDEPFLRVTPVELRFIDNGETFVEPPEGPPTS